MKERTRILIAKPGLDGHDRGAKIVARGLRDAGYEVIYTGLHQTPESIVQAVLQEDVRLLGLSILSGAHNTIVADLMSLLQEHQLNEVRVLVGGIIPQADIPRLRAMGVEAVFAPGTSIGEIVGLIERKNDLAEEGRA